MCVCVFCVCMLIYTATCVYNVIISTAIFHITHNIKHFSRIGFKLCVYNNNKDLLYLYKTTYTI